MKRSSVLWRFRRNPLRRRSYLVEGWGLLALGAAATVGSALTGLAITGKVDARYAQQRHDRYTVTAVLTQDADAPTTYAASSWTPVRWALPGGQTRTGIARVNSGLKRGERTTIWLDAHGRPAAKPLSPSAGLLAAAMTGSAAGFGLCIVALIGGGVTVSSLERRRLDRWETEWVQVGPEWDRRTA